ncbi:MAG: tripartite tricarboxylate transporter permease, partial [archaeon]
MIIEIILAILLGVLVGAFSGLFPGIHINLVSGFLVYYSIFLTGYFEPIVLVVAIVSLAMTHTFLDFIPSIFLGAPNEDTAMSIMPGHELLMEGRGHEAVMLSIYGCFVGIILSLVFVPIFIFLIPIVYPFFQRMMAWILIWVVIFLVYQEKRFRLWAIFIFVLSGFLGVASLNMGINQPLLPLLSGLFGASALIESISQKVNLPPQRIEKFSFNKKGLLKPIFATSLIAPVCSFLPGLGSSQAAIIGSGIFKEDKALDRRQFLVLVGMINSFVMAMSFVVIYVLA